MKGIIFRSVLQKRELSGGENVLWVYVEEIHADTHKKRKKEWKILQNGGRMDILGMRTVESVMVPIK